jgi:hypothetical protein
MPIKARPRDAAVLRIYSWLDWPHSAPLSSKAAIRSTASLIWRTTASKPKTSRKPLESYPQRFKHVILAVVVTIPFWGIFGVF